MKPAIEVKSVWKQYRKGVDRRYKSLRDTLAGLPSLLRGEDEETFWALQDISFDVEPGKSIGIIGKNGAGKSTLLKILSRITPPTKGEIILRGRVASLLEVGTGFHPELTGRENIFFNGSILGMKYAEIRSRFDEIVDFSGVETFLDTPLKHYSSGMQMRLAFSVAAHLDAEILLIDEVLAVGDAEFQNKCFGKMDQVSKGDGKSLLFVSHDVSVIHRLCPVSIFLKDGSVLFSGNSIESIQTYQKSLSSNILTENFDKINSDSLRVLNVTLKGNPDNIVYTFSDFTIDVQLNTITIPKQPICKIDIGINNDTGKRVAWMSSFNFKYDGESCISFSLKDFPLREGLYNCNLYFEVNGNVVDWHKNILPFSVKSNIINITPKSQSDFELNYQVVKI